jgi:transcriptional regulator with XRE-family HTH domain
MYDKIMDTVQRNNNSREELLAIIRNHALDHADQAAIARKCGVSKQTVNAVLRGKSENLAVLEAIAECAEKHTRREAVFQRLQVVVDAVCSSFSNNTNTEVITN